ncbi:kinase-like domain-containing protein [Mycena sanguinolenta]|nr:kinase-like domain-containing protein [Mycena sanguinolenta]
MFNQPTPDHLSASSSSSTPSFISRIDLETITAVATTARHRTTSLSVACMVHPVPKLGALNAVWFIDFADGGQWVLRTPIAEWNPTLEKRLRSDIVGMQLIQSRTSIPIPRIYDFCGVPNNPFGRPYMLMDRVKGTQLAKLWFDPVWATEERRNTVFCSLVSFMSQLRLLKFPTIGNLDFDPSTDSHVVVPLLPSFDDIINGHTTTRGLYNTVHAFLLDEIARQTTSAPSMDHKVSLSLLRLFAGALPDHALDGPPFVLSMPDFNYQNVFVGNNGQVTGLIDWDGIMVGPRQGGYARYPSWITRDWDPLLYGYPESSVQREDEGSGMAEGGEKSQIPSREELQEDSSSILQIFRDEYLAVFEKVDSTSARYTRNSHVYEALEIAISAPYCRGHILERLTKYVFANEAESGQTISAWSLEEGIRAGDWVKASSELL